MTVATNDRRKQHVASAAQTVFDYDFEIYVETDLEVKQTVDATGITTTLIYLTDYTVTGVGVEAGGTIVLTSGAAVDDIMTIEGQTELARASDFTTGGDFLAGTVNDAEDRQYHIDQEAKRDAERTLQLKSEDTTTTAPFTIPTKADRLNKLAGYDNVGDPNAVTAASIGAVIISGNAPQDLGVAAAGSTGEVSDAGHIHKLPTNEELGLEIGVDVLAPDGDGSGLTGIAEYAQGGSFLSVVGANLSLAPKNGNKVMDGAGNILIINSTPVTLAIGAAAASTWYYIYGSATAGTIDALEFSATVPVTAANGVQHKTGAVGSVLLGWSQTTSAPAWGADFTYSLFNELEAPTFMARDEKANTTVGGSASATNNHTRTLNTVLKNTIFGASLASNQITLPAATYEFNGSAPGNGVNAHKAFIYNTSDTADEMIGTSENSSTGAVQTRSFVKGLVVLAATKVLELRHYTQAAGGNGLGAATSTGQIEVYSDITIRKVV